jgi:hypothetical protein
VQEEDLRLLMSCVKYKGCPASSVAAVENSRGPKIWNNAKVCGVQIALTEERSATRQIS